MTMSNFFTNKININLNVFGSFILNKNATNISQYTKVAL